LKNTWNPTPAKPLQIKDSGNTDPIDPMLANMTVSL
jgi:hypothetical protein